MNAADALMGIFGFRRECSHFTPLPLADDVCRCHDEECKNRTTCTRYTQPAGDYTPHCNSMREV